GPPVFHEDGVVAFAFAGVHGESDGQGRPGQQVDGVFEERVEVVVLEAALPGELLPSPVQGLPLLLFGGFGGHPADPQQRVQHEVEAAAQVVGRSRGQNDLWCGHLLPPVVPVAEHGRGDRVHVVQEDVVVLQQPAGAVVLFVFAALAAAGCPGAAHGAAGHAAASRTGSSAGASSCGGVTGSSAHGADTGTASGSELTTTSAGTSTGSGSSASSEGPGAAGHATAAAHAAGSSTAAAHAAGSVRGGGPLAVVGVLPFPLPGVRVLPVEGAVRAAHYSRGQGWAAGPGRSGAGRDSTAGAAAPAARRGGAGQAAAAGGGGPGRAGAGRGGRGAHGGVGHVAVGRRLGRLRGQLSLLRGLLLGLELGQTADHALGFGPVAGHDQFGFFVGGVEGLLAFFVKVVPAGERELIQPPCFNPTLLGRIELHIHAVGQLLPRCR